MNINTIAEFLNSKHLKYSYKKRIINLLGLFLGRKKRKELRNMLVDNYDEITFKQADVCFYNKDLNNKIIKLENHIPHDVSLAYFVESNLKKIKPRKKWIYMDAGCGTGYTLWKASSSFSKVIGVEYMSELAHIAQDNLKKLKVSNATVINDDICNISPEILKNVNVFYMYNPFTGDIMDNFIKNIVASINLNDREVYIIYVNDVCKDILEKYENVLPLKYLIENKAWRDTRIYHHTKEKE